MSLGRVSSSGQMWVAHSLGIAPGGELGIGVVVCVCVCDGGYMEAVLLWCWVVSSRSRRDQLQPLFKDEQKGVVGDFQAPNTSHAKQHEHDLTHTTVTVITGVRWFSR